MSGSIRIYGKEQISATHILVPDNVDAEITVPVRGGTSELKFILCFEKATGLAAGSPASSNWISENGVVRFNFRGWSNQFGTSFTEPYRIGDIGGVGLYVQVLHYRIEPLNNVTLFVLLGDTK